MNSLTDIKRILDLILALLLTILMLPAWCIFFVLVVLRRVSLSRTVRSGMNNTSFSELTFILRSEKSDRLLRNLSFYKIPVLLNIIKGDMSFVGPRAVSPEETDLNNPEFQKRSSVRPGLVCTWWIRKRTNIDFGSEIETDMEYIGTSSLKGDLSLMIRALTTLMYGTSEAVFSGMITILDIPIDNIYMDEALESVAYQCSGNQPTQVCFLNADCVNKTFNDSEYLDVLQSAHYVFPDGIGIKIAGKILQLPICQNINGTDMFPRLCETLDGSGNGIFLLGAAPGIAERVVEWIKENYKNVNISGWHHGYFTEEEESGVIKLIKDSNADLLLVAFGAPRQDIWINRHLSDTGVNVAMGVGGLFDFYSGNIPRAPLWLREMGMEWVYRLYREPGRMWKRYLVGNFVFLFRILRARLMPDKYGTRLKF